MLIQIDSDMGDESDLNWCWGDLGTLYVAVQHEDLLAGRFDRTWTIMQCS